MSERAASAWLLAALLGACCLAGQQVAAAALRDVRAAPASFNPGRGDGVELVYRLTEDDAVTVRVYDPDGGLARTLLERAPHTAGEQRVRWDGRDEEGRLVPDEAYTFTVETASGAVYDPTATTGGRVGDVTEAEFDREAGTVAYRLPEAARVLIRLGVRDGPMLRTLVDWKPRVAGTITEYWDGFDSDGLVRLYDVAGFQALITYVTLPAATVIAYGNDRESYRRYKLDRAMDRPRKPERPRQLDPEQRLFGGALLPPAWARAPQVSLAFPELAAPAEVPEVRPAGLRVRVDVDPADRERLVSEQFEILFFVDNVFFAEAERGYLPFNWMWELVQLPPGEHVLTVNVASFRGQVGVASRRVRIVRPDG